MTDHAVGIGRGSSAAHCDSASGDRHVNIGKVDLANRSGGAVAAVTDLAVAAGGFHRNRGGSLPGDRTVNEDQAILRAGGPGSAVT